MAPPFSSTNVPGNTLQSATEFDSIHFDGGMPNAGTPIQVVSLNLALIHTRCRHPVYPLLHVAMSRIAVGFVSLPGRTPCDPFLTSLEAV